MLDRFVIKRPRNSYESGGSIPASQSFLVPSPSVPVNTTSPGFDMNEIISDPGVSSGVSYVFSSQSREMEVAYHTRLTATLDVISLLLRHGLSFRGHDESSTSMNRGNFLEFLDWYSKRNKNISDVVSQNAPCNNQMTSPYIQKQMVNVCAVETTLAILHDIGDKLFTILVDESRDISVKEHMAVVLRYCTSYAFDSTRE
ncbi:hypothetical protein POM88_011072 [Heracleum sosnowskyi]|uniref:DUF4371 domain-containing protein n=1 Tax=Heracleum sosnowskyi TaxID=360622 RepID=A0AAD8IUU7_9APIA|nr:hypothetical protein POM88_011072 [Heracleum sosnowskyi]